MKRLYYTPPSEKCFNELKQKAIEIWQSYDNTYGDVDEKVGRIKDIRNIADNFMYMVAMFDFINQERLANLLSEETRQAVKERMIDGGNPPEYIKF